MCIRDRAVADLAPEAILINCSMPEALTAAMSALATSRVPFGAYANGFTQIIDDYAPGDVTTVLGHRHDLQPDTYADVVETWLGHGATIVGGCCEIGPEHIAAVRRRLDRLGAGLS